MPTATVFLTQSMGIISMTSTTGDGLSPEKSISADQLQAFKVFGRDTEGEPEKYKVALQILDVVAMPNDSFFLKWIDPIELTLDGEPCLDAQQFMDWFEVAVSGDVVDTSIFELVANKAVSFDIVNDTKYPTVAAVAGYVQGQVAAGNGAQAVKVASRLPLDFSPTYANGASGIGATLTATAFGILLIGDYEMQAGDRALIMNEANQAHNGIFEMTVKGGVATHYVLTRAADYDEPSNINNTGVIPSTVYKNEDDINEANTLWLLTSGITTIGVDAFIYTRYTMGSNVVATKTDTLEQFAPTTSEQLANVLSDENGYSAGATVLFSKNPTIEGMTIPNAKNIVLGTGTGTMIGTAANQKLSLWGAAPVAQQTGNIFDMLVAMGMNTSPSISAANMAPLLAAVNTWTKAQRGQFLTVSYAATLALDFSTSNNFRTQLTGNVTLDEPTNIGDGQSGVINMWQDSTGSRLFNTPAWCFVTIDGGTITLGTTKNTCDQIAYMVNFYATSNVTITIANPCVVTWNNHGLFSGMKIRLTTTGALPTGLAAATTYWVSVIDANTFRLATSKSNLDAGTYIATTGSQSGTHTARCKSITISKNSIS